MDRADVFFFFLTGGLRQGGALSPPTVASHCSYVFVITPVFCRETDTCFVPNFQNCLKYFFMVHVFNPFTLQIVPNNCLTRASLHLIADITCSAWMLSNQGYIDEFNLVYPSLILLIRHSSSLLFPSELLSPTSCWI